MHKYMYLAFEKQHFHTIEVMSIIWQGSSSKVTRISLKCTESKFLP